MNRYVGVRLSSSGLSVALALALAACAWPDASSAPAATTPGGQAATTGRESTSSDEATATGTDAHFAKLDASGDGTVTAAEMDASRQAMRADTRMSSADKMKTIDTNQNNALSAEEHAQASRTMFATMDTDKNGQLSRTEVQAGHDRMMGHKQ